MDIDALTDPEVSAAVAAATGALPPLDASTLEVYRSIAPPPAEPPPGVSRTVVRVPVRDAPDVEVRVHRPIAASAGGGARGALVWIHGGGYVLGRAAMDDARLGAWAERFDCVTVSVEYRLAPEAAYPGALDDCRAALAWTHEQAGAWGVAPDRIGVGGISAGGGLAAAVALAARDTGGPPVAFQCLVYPMLDDRMAHASNHWASKVWPPSANRFGWDAYLAGTDPAAVPPWAAPARATDLSGLPPALLVVGALDCFVDEDVDHAMRLNRSGVPCELHVYPGGGHGLESMAPHSRPGAQLRRDVEAWLERMLRAGSARPA